MSLQISWVDVCDCDAPHRVSHPEKVDELARAFIRGWGKGYPALIGYLLADRIQLLSGSHRIEAAWRAGLNRIPVVIRTIEEVEEAWGDLEKWQKIMSAPEV